MGKLFCCSRKQLTFIEGTIASKPDATKVSFAPHCSHSVGLPVCHKQTLFAYSIRAPQPALATRFRRRVCERGTLPSADERPAGKRGPAARSTFFALRPM